MAILVVKSKGKKTYFRNLFKKRLVNSNFDFIRLKKEWNGVRIMNNSLNPNSLQKATKLRNLLEEQLLNLNLIKK